MDHRYAMILGNLGNTRDRFCGGYKTNPSSQEMLQKAVQIPHISGIELVGTWDIDENNALEMKKLLEDQGMACVSIIPDLFADPAYGKGSFTHSDPSIRRKAIHYTRAMCQVALELDCPTINLWLGQDGYDYLLCTDYAAQRDWLQIALTELGAEFHDLRFALEYKPKEPRTHSTLARMADTLLMVQEVGLSNIGVTIDTGHAYVAGEVVAESIVLAQRAGNRLFHMHFNDNHASWDDDMMVGSVHTVCYLETLYWLHRTGYTGWLSMDQYPYREDAASAIGESVLWLHRFADIVDANLNEIGNLLSEGDPIATSRFLRRVLIGG